MKRLSDIEYRIYKFYSQGMTIPEIAEVVAIDTAEARAILSVAMDKLWHNQVERSQYERRR